MSSDGNTRPRLTAKEKQHAKHLPIVVTSTFESLADVVSKGGRVQHVTLAASRESDSARNGGEERKTHSQLHPDLVAEVKRLRRASPKTGERLSYRKISKQLALPIGKWTASFISPRWTFFDRGRKGHGRAGRRAGAPRPKRKH